MKKRKALARVQISALVGLLFVCTTVLAGSATVIGIDLGSVATTNWNNITGASQTIAAGAVVDTSGKVVDGVSIVWSRGGGGTLTTQFGGWQEYPINSLPDMPESARADAHWGSPLTLTVQGLNPDRKCTLAVVAHSGNGYATYQSIMTITGVTTNQSTYYRADNANTSTNLIDTLWDGIYRNLTNFASTAEGSITIKCTAGNEVLNAVRIEIEPGPPAGTVIVIK